MMTSQRNSRIYSDQDTYDNDNHHTQPAASAYVSRRSSRGSFNDTTIYAGQEMEEAQRANVMAWGSQASSHKSHTSTCCGKDSPPLDMPSKYSDKPANSMSSSSSISDLSEYPTPTSDGRPTNFGVVIPGVYRSSYPKPQNYDFLRNLGLKTVVTLVKKDELDHDLVSFVTSNDIRQVIFNMKGTKKEAIPMSTMSSILELVLDRDNYPLMLHCNHGKHRTGCVVAAIRKLSGWQLNTVIDEYKSYAEPKVRECDVDYISTLQCGPLQSLYSLHNEAATIFPIQARTFFRALLFSAFVMLLWLVSGSRMSLGPDDAAI